MPTLNIILNLCALSNRSLHLGQTMFFSKIILSNSDRSELSGTTIEVISVISLSALKIDLHFLHLTIGSAKLERCPDAIKTDCDIIWEPSISIILSLRTNSRLHSSTNLFFRLTPDGPYSQN